MRNFLMQVTSKAWIALLFGFLILGVAVYTQLRANADVHGASVESLVARTGKIIGANEVTQTNNRRRGGSSTRKYYIMDAKLEDDSIEKWMIDYSIDLDKVESLVNKAVSVRIDPSNSNLVYEAVLNGQVIIPLADVQKIMERKDRVAASNSSNKGTLIVGSLALAFGIVGLIVRRRLIRSYSKEHASDVESSL